MSTIFISHSSKDLAVAQTHLRRTGKPRPDMLDRQPRRRRRRQFPGSDRHGHPFGQGDGAGVLRTTPTIRPRSRKSLRWRARTRSPSFRPAWKTSFRPPRSPTNWRRGSGSFTFEHRALSLPGPKPICLAAASSETLARLHCCAARGKPTMTSAQQRTWHDLDQQYRASVAHQFARYALALRFEDLPGRRRAPRQAQPARRARQRHRRLRRARPRRPARRWRARSGARRRPPCSAPGFAPASPARRWSIAS